ncbi:MAG TPA: adenosine kinase [Spirochaetota bacterium]|nr:adenosine kinase [Spirochaetota bacterium]
MKIKKSKYDVAGIGAALLDFTVNVDDAFLKEINLVKGHMQLVDEAASAQILEKISHMEMSVAPGGSSANTLAGVAALGGRGAFMGRVGSDSNAERYIGDTRKTGVESFIKQGSGMTGHAITFITPDSQRTFATHLGACTGLSMADIDFGIIEQSSIIHLEGYLFEPEQQREICYEAMKRIKSAGGHVSIDLADPSLIGRIKNVFDDVIEKYADIVFANEDEVLAYTGKKEHDGLHILAEKTSFAVAKLGERGSLIKTGGNIIKVDPFKVNVVNTNGAGDMYAAGILYGLASGKSAEVAGKIASYASSLVVSSAGARYNGRIDPGGLI